MKKLLIAILILLIPSLVFAGTYSLPNARKPTPDVHVAWSPGFTIPTISDDDLQPLAAGATVAQIETCLATGGKSGCLLGAGTFTVDSQIDVPTGKLLRGAGEGVTILRTSGTGTWIPISIAGSGSAETSLNLSASAVIGGTTLSLSATTGLAVGEFIRIDETAEAGLVDPGSATWTSDGRATRYIRQISKITNIDGNTITIDPPSNWDYDIALTAQVTSYGSGFSYQTGIENLTVDVESNVGQAAIKLNYAYQCWIKGVEVDKAADESGIEVDRSLECVIRDSYVHHSYNNAYGSGSGRGFRAMYGTTNTLFENNRAFYLRHAYMTAAGTSGVVFGYNFSDAAYDSDGVNTQSHDMDNHGTHCVMTLWEGNIINKFMPDSFNGTSSHTTAFRNWATGVRSTPAVTNIRYAFMNMVKDYYISAVGNVLGTDALSGTYDHNCGSNPTTSGYYCFAFTTGNNNSAVSCPSTEISTIIRHRNRCLFSDTTDTQSGETDLDLPNSYYLSEQPSWWCVGVPWPPIGSDIAGYTNDIPAKIIYESGSCTADATAPTVTALVIPSTSESLSVPITTFTCTDAVGVTGYKITLTADVPGSGDQGWFGSALESYTVGDYGEFTLYAWCKDAAGNVSDSLNDTVTVSQIPGTVTGVGVKYNLGGATVRHQ